MTIDALWSIRVRTPRLELRLPTDDELEALYDVADAGIHPPEEMPFAIPWTDSLERGAFTSYHREAWQTWQPESWRCNFVTFLDGQPIGSQGIEAADFATEKTIVTGSWLGRAYQRRGYGFEQRAAVLEFGFAGLGADAATSGAFFTNLPSQRISEQLGYRVTGVSEFSPRGEAVQHYDYRLDREDWHCPVDVRVEGLEPALPLFGVRREP